MIQAGIIGATGYAGAELLRLLLAHPEVNVSAVSSVSFAGKRIDEIYPNFRGACDLTLGDEEQVLARSEVVFAALPHGLSEPTAAACRAAGKPFFDLGADFRLESEQDYETWYGKPFQEKELHAQAVYGLPELCREQIRQSKLVAVPGCFPTVITLGLYPALAEKLCAPHGIVIDAKSGASGAGRKPTDTTHFSALNENIHAYRAGMHRHTPEIRQILSRMAGERVSFTFVPHLLPINRGILATMYLTPAPGVTLEHAHAAYRAFYRDERFVRVLAPGEYACVRDVRYTNCCAISLHEDAESGVLIVCAAIDNMVKGTAGAAVQCMNLVCGLPEETGLAGLVAPAF